MALRGCRDISRLERKASRSELLMQRLHRTMGVFIRLDGACRFTRVSWTSDWPHIASRIPNVLSINHHKRLIVLKIQSAGPILDRDEIGPARIPGNHCAREI
jgi:hypothetical protein